MGWREYHKKTNLSLLVWVRKNAQSGMNAFVTMNLFG
jgi:hypothetical protein